MSYANGRVYTEVVGGQQVGVSIYDVQRALQTGIVTDVKGLCAHQNVNPWARYRPIPCMIDGNNTILPLYDSQRQQERYGVAEPIDMFTADDVAAYEAYAAQLQQKGVYFIKLRPWGDTHWARLHDFVKTGYDNVGYDHKAQCDNVKVNITGGCQAYQVGEHYLAPLIPVGQRELYIADGDENGRFEFPNDHIWMDLYYEKIYGTTAAQMTVEGNPEWLSPIDFMGQSTYYDNLNYASVRRRVIIFKWEYDQGEYKWKFYNYATDTVGGNNRSRPFDSNKGAWLDLTSSEQDINTAHNVGQRRLKDLEGRCLFIDVWVEATSSVNVFPVLGFAYEVYIDRTTDIRPDVTGVLTFVRVMVTDETEQGEVYYHYVLFIDYAPDQLGLNGGLVDCGVQAVAALSEYFDSLTITLGNVSPINILNSSLDFSTDTDGEGDWFRLNCDVYVKQSPQLDISTATITARRKDISVSSTKIISVSET